MGSSLHQAPSILADIDVKTSVEVAYVAPISTKNAKQYVNQNQGQNKANTNLFK